jgi:hypothetical protein
MFKKSWNPYVAGGLAGVLLILSVALTDQFFGASTTFPRSASWLGQFFDFDMSVFAYFQIKNGKYGPSSLPNWQFVFVLGIFIGAFFSSIFSGEFKVQFVPGMWRTRFGANPLKRAVIAFLGGVVALFGARLAGG